MGLGRRLGVLVGALSIATLLWAYVRLSQSYETAVDLPVVVTPPQGLALTSAMNSHLHATIKGAGWQILMMGFTKSSHFQLDLSSRDITDPSRRQFTIHADDLAHTVVLPSEVKLLKVEPDSLMLSFGTVTRKRVPLRVPVEVTTAGGYTIVGAPEISPSTLIVVGSHAVLDSLSSYPTKPLIQQGVREDVLEELDLSDTLLNAVTFPQLRPVKVRLHVEAVAERVFHGIPIELQAVPPDKEIVLIPSDVSITVRGGVDELSSLQASSLHARLMYDAIEFDTARSVKPSIEYPSGLSFLECSPERIRFVVRRKSEPENATK